MTQLILAPWFHTLCHVLPTKWRSYRDHRFCDVTRNPTTAGIEGWQLCTRVQLCLCTRCRHRGMLNVESEKLQCTQWYDTYLNIVILICTKLVFCLHWFVWCVMYCVVSPISPRFIGIQYVYSDVTKGWGRKFCPPLSLLSFVWFCLCFVYL